MLMKFFVVMLLMFCHSGVLGIEEPHYLSSDWLLRSFHGDDHAREISLKDMRLMVKCLPLSSNNFFFEGSNNTNFAFHVNIFSIFLVMNRENSFDRLM